MSLLSNLIDYGVIGLLLLLSIWAVAIAVERIGYFRRISLHSFPSEDLLETALTRRLFVIGTIASNAPYLGLLGTVLGIMLTFYNMGNSGLMDAKSIMVGLSLAMKSTAMGLVVAIPCVVINNTLRRRVRELISEYRKVSGVPYGA